MWLSFATFEVSNATASAEDDVNEDGESKPAVIDQAGLDIARDVYRRADEYFKGRGKDERVLVLDAWLAFERQYGNDNSIYKLASPRRQLAHSLIYTHRW